MGVSNRPAGNRIATAVTLGIAATIGTQIAGMSGLVVIPWIAGFLALLFAPGMMGWGAVLAGIVIGVGVVTLVLAVTGANGGGLLALAVLILLAIASHGALVAAVLDRIRANGPAVALRDGRVLGGGAIAVAIALFFWWVAGEFARNPP